MLAKSCNDAGWSAFINKLDSKAADAGSQLAYVNPRGTSQTYLCGAPVPTILRPCWHQGEVGGAHDRQRCREGLLNLLVFSQKVKKIGEPDLETRQ